MPATENPVPFSPFTDGSSSPYSVAMLGPDASCSAPCRSTCLMKTPLSTIALRGRIAVERHFALPLNHQFAIPLQAEVADHGRSDRYPFRALAPPAERPQLQLQFALLRNVGVRRVVRAKGKCGLRQRQEAQHE